MFYEFLGNYAGFTIERRDDGVHAVAWDCHTNSPKSYFCAQSVSEVEAFIDTVPRKETEQ